MDEFVNEVWKEIDGFPTYEISNCGNIRNIKTKMLRKLSPNAYGYPYVTVRQGGKYFALRIHVLVAKAFLAPSAKVRPQINHIDGVKTNNHVFNLEWVTASENIKHAYETGLNRGHRTRQTQITAASGIKGVTFHRGKWRAVLCTNNQKVYLGRFATPELAGEAYKNAEKMYGLESN